MDEGFNTYLNAFCQRGPLSGQSAYPGYLELADACNKENPVSLMTAPDNIDRALWGRSVIESRPCAVDAEKSRVGPGPYSTLHSQNTSEPGRFKHPPLGISSAVSRIQQARISPGSAQLLLYDGCPRHRHRRRINTNLRRTTVRDDSASPFTSIPSRCNCGLPMRWNDAGLLASSKYLGA